MKVEEKVLNASATKTLRPLSLPDMRYLTLFVQFERIEMVALS